MMRMIERLDLWSLIHVAIMMVIGLTQVKIFIINEMKQVTVVHKTHFRRFTW